ncbi:LysR family transcriptional regulator [Rhodococcoides fascians]|uniref:LysR family transcriptional regulator n=1 Tax=Rhodococcoides fascians TaxID=1828 RepID=UPI0006916702|nr:LysR family transcriptional regulator [Rhodococcus fascians]
MSLTRLQYFVVVAEEASFTRASARLHISQPPLTQQIKTLEREVGQELFTRSPRRITLTPAGEALLPEARRILERYQRLPALLREAANENVRSLNLGCIASAVIGLVPQLLPAVGQLDPPIAVRLQEAGVEVQLNRLRSGDLDAGLVRVRELDDEWHCVDAAPDYYCAAVPAEHPLAAQEAVRWRDLANEVVVIADRSRASLEFDTVIAACSKNGFTPVVLAEAITGYNVIPLVAGGRGIAVVPERVSAFKMDGVVYRPLTPSAAAVPMRLIARRNKVDASISQLGELVRSASVPMCR